jgi:hypothetical protein
VNLGELGPCCLDCGRSPHDGPCPPDPFSMIVEVPPSVRRDDVPWQPIVLLFFGVPAAVVIVGPPIVWVFETFIAPALDAWFRYWGVS